jgi:hypothetical protein
MVKVHVTIQRVDTKAYFESWNGTRYEVILGRVWLKQVNACIACKEGVVHEKFQNGKFLSIQGKRSMSNVPMLSHLQMKRCGRKNSSSILDTSE